ncbi:hypothetical protein ACFS07_34600 [Undibacterium arcticum]
MTEALEAMQQAPKLIFPGEHAFDGVEPFFKKMAGSKNGLRPRFDFSAAWVGVDVGGHAAIENRFAVAAAIIGAIQTDDRAA